MTEISNPKLGIFMATEVIGWHRKEGDALMVDPDTDEILARLPESWRDSHDNFKAYVLNWKPWEDLNQAMECVKEVVGNHPHSKGGSYVSWEMGLQLLTRNISFRITNLADISQHGNAHDKSPARAVCLALKAFIENQKKEEKT